MLNHPHNCPSDVNYSLSTCKISHDLDQISNEKIALTMTNKCGIKELLVIQQLTDIRSGQKNYEITRKIMIMIKRSCTAPIQTGLT